MTEASSARWLITGSTGFLGRHVIDAIRQHDPAARIVALVRHPDRLTGPDYDYLANVELLEGSPLDAVSWKDDPSIGSVSGIYHLAAEVRHSRSGAEPMVRLNVNGTRAMVELASAKKCRIVFASTSGTVGCSTSDEYTPDENAPFAESVVRRWPYYASKVRAEKEARALADKLGVYLVIVRPPVLLGPGDHRQRSTGNVLRVLQHRLPVIPNGGIHFADIRDCARAMVCAMTHAHPRPVYNLPGTSCTLDEFFRLVAQKAGIQPWWRTVPSRLLWYAAKSNELIGRPIGTLPDSVVIEMANHHWGLSSRYAGPDLGYRSRDPQVTIGDTVNWLRHATAV